MSQIPLHPEATSDPQRLRWVIPAGVLGLVGPPRVVPDALARLLADGTLDALCVEPAAVVTTLGPGRSWRTIGPAVRSALAEALADPEGWLPAEASDGTPEARLRAVADAVVAGSVGDYIRSHAGTVEIVGVGPGRVRVTLGGTCADCPARSLTLGLRVEKALRDLYPGLVDVEIVEARSTRRPAGGRRAA